MAGENLPPVASGASFRSVQATSRLVGLSRGETVENVTALLRMLADFVGDRPDETPFTAESRAGVAMMLDMAIDALRTLDSEAR